MGKKVFILAKNIGSKRKFEIKAKKNSAIWVTLIQAVVSKTLRLSYKIFFCLQNIGTLQKSASSLHYGFLGHPNSGSCVQNA